MSEIIETQTSDTEIAHKNAPIVLLVRAIERPKVARALLAAAAEAGAPAEIVRSTSDGYIVPRYLADLADLVLAEDVAAPIEGQLRAYAAAVANGVDQVRPPADEVTPDPAPEAGPGPEVDQDGRLLITRTPVDGDEVEALVEAAVTARVAEIEAAEHEDQAAAEQPAGDEPAQAELPVGDELGQAEQLVEHEVRPAPRRARKAAGK